MSEEEAIAELKSMNIEQLDLVPYTEVKLICHGKKCCNGTIVRDYGIAPEYYHKRMKWHNIQNRFFACGKHFKMYNRLIKSFDIEKVHLKLFDYNKNIIITDFKKRRKINT